MHFLIRCDSSTIIGSGHLMRCLTLAHILRNAGHSISFICASLEGSQHERIRTNGFSLHLLPAAKLSQDEDASECKNILSGYPINTVIILDHYGLDVTWERHFYPQYRIIVIDDLANRKHLCHGLVNNNFERNFSDRYQNLVPLHCKLLLGPQYSFLREEIVHARKDHNLHRSGVLVFFGGTDPTGETLKFADALCKTHHNYEYTLAITSANPRLELLKKLTQNNDLNLAIDADFARLLSSHSLYLGSGGTVTWERIYLGLPGIVISVAENQRAIAEELGNAGYQDYLGTSENLDYEKVIRLCEERCTDIDWQAKIRERTKYLVNKINSSHITELIETPYLRPANSSDADFLYRLRTHPRINEMSTNTGTFDFKSHVQWLERRIEAKDAPYIIVYKSHACGQVRIDSNNVVSISIMPEYHGLGLASKAIEMAINKDFAAKHLESQNYTAIIKEQNTASIKTFSRIGFTLTEIFTENGNTLHKYTLIKN